MSAGPLLPQIERIWGRKSLDYCAGETARAYGQPRDMAKSADWQAGWRDAHTALTAPEPTEGELDAERAFEDAHGWRDRDWG